MGDMKGAAWSTPSRLFRTFVLPAFIKEEHHIHLLLTLGSDYFSFLFRSYRLLPYPNPVPSRFLHIYDLTLILLSTYIIYVKVKADLNRISYIKYKSYYLNNIIIHINYTIMKQNKSYYLDIIIILYLLIFNNF